MGDLSKNFSRAEFACRCSSCNFDTVDAELVAILQDVRDHFGAPVTITSGCRCALHNRAVGGGERSQHLYGRAADIVVTGVPAASVHAYLLARVPAVGGLGKYATFTHVDTRTNGPARW